MGKIDSQYRGFQRISHPINDKHLTHSCVICEDPNILLNPLRSVENMQHYIIERSMRLYPKFGLFGRCQVNWFMINFSTPTLIRLVCLITVIKKA